MKIFSFPPISTPESRILILGTMPGKRSLEKNEYYGHRNNKFWKILFHIFDLEYPKDYNQKIALLKLKQIALWDVLQGCERESSADSDIRNEVPNDFSLFFKNHQNIKSIFFNGKKAGEYFEKFFPENRLPKFVLPSTSPANSWYTYEEKVKKWRMILDMIS
jgi:hypoxanthine-DNA glycosylase